jgi:voltage-gated potassium channel Kch
LRSPTLTVSIYVLSIDPDQKAITIARQLAETIEQLRTKGFVIPTVLTNNAFNEQAALNPRHASSVQRVAGTLLFQIPCLSQSQIWPFTIPYTRSVSGDGRIW